MQRLIHSTFLPNNSRAGVMYRHILTEDTGSAYVAALFSLLLKKILRTSAVAIVQDKVGQDSSSNANKSNQSEDVDLEAPESDEVAMFGNDLIRSYNMMMWASGVCCLENWFETLAH